MCPIGAKIKALTILGDAGLRADSTNIKHRRHFWTVQCTCGKIFDIGRSRVFQKGHYELCSHVPRNKGSRKSNLDYAPIKKNNLTEARLRHFDFRRISKTKFEAKQRGIEYNIEKDLAISLVKGSCFYCGNSEDLCGIDRTDSKQGYIPANVVTACGLCNQMKSNLPKNNFLLHILRIYRHSLIVAEHSLSSRCVNPVSEIKVEWVPMVQGQRE